MARGASVGVACYAERISTLVICVTGFFPELDRMAFLISGHAAPLTFSGVDWIVPRYE